MSALPSVRPSVRMEQLGSHCTDFHEIGYLSNFRKSVDKIKFFLKSEKNNGYLSEAQCTFLIILRSIILRMGMIADKVVG